MSDGRPRTLCWGARGPQPQIVFDDPRIGCEGLTILSQQKLDPADRGSFDQLAAAYPAPEAV